MYINIWNAFSFDLWNVEHQERNLGIVYCRATVSGQLYVITRRFSSKGLCFGDCYCKPTVAGQFYVITQCFWSEVLCLGGGGGGGCYCKAPVTGQFSRDHTIVFDLKRCTCACTCRPLSVDVFHPASPVVTCSNLLRSFDPPPPSLPTPPLTLKACADSAKVVGLRLQAEVSCVCTPCKTLCECCSAVN